MGQPVRPAPAGIPLGGPLMTPTLPTACAEAADHCGHDVNVLIDIEVAPGKWSAFCETCAAPDVCAHPPCTDNAIPGSAYCGPHDEDAAAEWDRITARPARRAATPAQTTRLARKAAGA